MRCPILLAALTLTAAPASPATGQEADRPGVSDQDRSRGHRMLQRLRETLERYYYDSTYHGIDLDLHVARTDSAIDRATTLPEMTAALAEFLHVLDDSHTRFLPPGLRVTVDYGWSWIMIGDDCYVSAVKAKSAAADSGLKLGDRVLAIDGIRPTRQNLSLISYVYFGLSPRPGMRLVVARENGQRAELRFASTMKPRPPVQDLKDLESQRRFWEEEERSIPRHRWRELDSVLVWRLPAFMYRDEQIDRVMERARRHRWLILDLRGNSGGSVEAMLRLLGHFFPQPFDAFTTVRRDSTTPERVVPQGGAPYAGEAIVLIDSRSASASELTSRVLQMRGRAMIVGDRSAGAVMGSYFISLTLGSIFQERVLPFGMSVTVMDAIMPDSSRLEKAGVIPNVAALPTAADLAAKRDPALQFALEMAGVRMTAEDAAKVLSR
jgi:carboxyl-terminal processing protease